ncbi:MAG: (2Fe-2S)-binding protein [Betaproteobacteria bacterium]|nr:(2Fe-2S)-binding protein [Betaproteobacteria bacterium]
MSISLTVNGKAHRVDAPDSTPLLYVLRNDLGLKGTRFGCGTGHCGACHVLLDGHTVAACDTPLWSAAGKAVTTVEGLAGNGVPHPLQQAFLDEQAAQCGYCVSGVIMTAAGLLSANPSPSDEDLRCALDRNLCRCGAHTRMLRAIKQAAEAMRHG